jgi:hypothetical protein
MLGEAYADWSSLLSWDMREAADQLEQHRPSPLDLEIELQEEVFVADWHPGELRETANRIEVFAV